MSRWVFFGRVIPERIPLGIGSPLRWSTEAADLGVMMDVAVCVVDGQVVCEANVTMGNVDALTVRNLIDADIRLVVDLIGYLHAIRYDVDVISAVNLETGDRTVFGIDIPVLRHRREHGTAGSYPPPGNLSGELLSAVASEPAARLALEEFREAMGSATGTGFHCYRAIEAMMQSVKTGNAEKDGLAWDRLRQLLCIGREALDFVKNHADLSRHGRPVSISDVDRAKVFEITDEVVRRYLLYISNGKKSLPAVDFHILRVPT